MHTEECLGTCAVAADSVSCTRHNSPVSFRGPLDDVRVNDLEPHVREVVFMLATFCFDLTRKMEYFYKALSPYALHANRALAREIFDHNEELHQATREGGWEGSARKSEEIIHALWDQVHEHHETAFRMVLELQPALTGDESAVQGTRAHHPPSRITEHLDALRGNGEDK